MDDESKLKTERLWLDSGCFYKLSYIKPFDQANRFVYVIKRL